MNDGPSSSLPTSVTSSGPPCSTTPPASPRSSTASPSTVTPSTSTPTPGGTRKPRNDKTAPTPPRRSPRATPPRSLLRPAPAPPRGASRRSPLRPAPRPPGFLGLGGGVYGP